jgi:hypothetical protein
MLRPSQSYIANSDAESFTLESFLLACAQDYDMSIAQFRDVMKTSKGRQLATHSNPLLFAITYLSHVLMSEQTNHQLSFNDVNLLLSTHALGFMQPKNTPKRDGLRRAYLSPRGSSKTSTVKCMLLWALAHGHLRYGLIFANSDEAAQKLMGSFKQEFDDNKLLARDFPDLCKPARRTNTNVAISDRQNVFVATTGTVLEARSVTSSVLGSKVGDIRPDALILDDTGRGVGVGSVYQEHQLLDTILDTILPLADTAIVLYIGTNHFIGSVSDQLMKSLTDKENVEAWISEENFSVHWLPPLVTKPDGTRRSIWPQRWSVEYLESQELTQTYARDFNNQPISSTDGSWWTADLFVYDTLPSISRRVISVDIGLSTKTTSDATGISVIGFSQAERKAQVDECAAFRLRGPDLKAMCLRLIEQYPDVDTVVWEQNAGGEALAFATLGYDFILPIHFVHESIPKLVRAERLLARYKQRVIVHAKPLRSYEAEALSLPFMAHSCNMVDSVGMGVHYFATIGTEQGLKIRTR